MRGEIAEGAHFIKEIRLPVCTLDHAATGSDATKVNRTIVVSDLQHVKVLILEGDAEFWVWTSL